MKIKPYKSLFALALIFLLFLSACSSDKGMPKLVDLGADKCIPCKEMAPILEELKMEYAGALEVEFIDVWKPENQDKAAKYGISKIPTQIFFDSNGNELWRHVGFISKEDILSKWKELGYDLKPQNTVIIDDSCSDCSEVGSCEGSSCK